MELCHVDVSTDIVWKECFLAGHENDQVVCKSGCWASVILINLFLYSDLFKHWPTMSPYLVCSQKWQLVTFAEHLLLLFFILSISDL